MESDLFDVLCIRRTYVCVYRHPYKPSSLKLVCHHPEKHMILQCNIHCYADYVHRSLLFSVMCPQLFHLPQILLHLSGDIEMNPGPPDDLPECTRLGLDIDTLKRRVHPLLNLGKDRLSMGVIFELRRYLSWPWNTIYWCICTMYDVPYTDYNCRCIADDIKQSMSRQLMSETFHPTRLVNENREQLSDAPHHQSASEITTYQTHTDRMETDSTSSKISDSLNKIDVPIVEIKTERDCPMSNQIELASSNTEPSFITLDKIKHEYPDYPDGLDVPAPPVDINRPAINFDKQMSDVDAAMPDVDQSMLDIDKPIANFDQPKPEFDQPMQLFNPRISTDVFQPSAAKRQKTDDTAVIAPQGYVYTAKFVLKSKPNQSTAPLTNKAANMILSEVLSKSNALGQKRNPNFTANMLIDPVSVKSTNTNSCSETSRHESHTKTEVADFQSEENRDFDIIRKCLETCGNNPSDSLADYSQCSEVNLSESDKKSSINDAQPPKFCILPPPMKYLGKFVKSYGDNLGRSHHHTPDSLIHNPLPPTPCVPPLPKKSAKIPEPVVVSSDHNKYNKVKYNKVKQIYEVTQLLMSESQRASVALSTNTNPPDSYRLRFQSIPLGRATSGTYLSPVCGDSNMYKPIAHVNPKYCPSKAGMSPAIAGALSPNSSPAVPSFVPTSIPPVLPPAMPSSLPQHVPPSLAPNRSSTTSHLSQAIPPALPPVRSSAISSLLPHPIPHPPPTPPTVPPSTPSTVPPPVIPCVIPPVLYSTISSTVPSLLQAIPPPMPPALSPVRSPAISSLPPQPIPHPASTVPPVIPSVIPPGLSSTISSTEPSLSSAIPPSMPPVRSPAISSLPPRPIPHPASTVPPVIPSVIPRGLPSTISSTIPSLSLAIPPTMPPALSPVRSPLMSSLPPHANAIPHPPPTPSTVPPPVLPSTISSTVPSLPQAIPPSIPTTAPPPSAIASASNDNSFNASKSLTSLEKIYNDLPSSAANEPKNNNVNTRISVQPSVCLNSLSSVNDKLTAVVQPSHKRPCPSYAETDLPSVDILSDPLPLKKPKLIQPTRDPPSMEPIPSTKQTTMTTTNVHAIPKLQSLTNIGLSDNAKVPPKIKVYVYSADGKRTLQPMSVKNQQCTKLLANFVENLRSSAQSKCDPAANITSTLELLSSSTTITNASTIANPSFTTNIVSTAITNTSTTITNSSTKMTTPPSTVIKESTTTTHPTTTIISASTKINDTPTTITNHSTKIINTSTPTTNTSTTVINPSSTITIPTTRIANPSMTITNLNSTLADQTTTITKPFTTITSATTGITNQSTKVINSTITSPTITITNPSNTITIPTSSITNTSTTITNTSTGTTDQSTNITTPPPTITTETTTITIPTTSITDTSTTITNLSTTITNTSTTITNPSTITTNPSNTITIPTTSVTNTSTTITNSSTTITNLSTIITNPSTITTNPSNTITIPTTSVTNTSTKIAKRSSTITKPTSDSAVPASSTNLMSTTMQPNTRSFNISVQLFSPESSYVKSIMAPHSMSTKLSTSTISSENVSSVQSTSAGLLSAGLSSAGLSSAKPPTSFKKFKKSSKNCDLSYAELVEENKRLRRKNKKLRKSCAYFMERYGTGDNTDLASECSDLLPNTSHGAGVVDLPTKDGTGCQPNASTEACLSNQNDNLIDRPHHQIDDVHFSTVSTQTYIPCPDCKAEIEVYRGNEYSRDYMKCVEFVYQQGVVMTKIPKVIARVMRLSKRRLNKQASSAGGISTILKKLKNEKRLQSEQKAAAGAEEDLTQVVHTLTPDTNAEDGESDAKDTSHDSDDDDDSQLPLPTD